MVCDKMTAQKAEMLQACQLADVLPDSCVIHCNPAQQEMPVCLMRQLHIAKRWAAPPAPLQWLAKLVVLQYMLH